MNRIDRLQAILIQLQSKRVVTAREIADRFDISIRTVYRDIRALEEAGVPVGAEAGVGYFLAENYQLPPVMFTNEEAVALLIGSKFVEQMSDSPTKKSFQSAMSKIRAVLRLSEKDHIEQLEQTISVYNYAMQHEEDVSLHLTEIQKALVEKKVLIIQYHSKGKDEKSCREVEPIGLCFYGNRWHLVAYCQLRNDYRDFRLDRILQLQVSDQSFAEKKHLSLNQIYADKLDKSGLIKIRLQIHNDHAKFIPDSKYWYGYSSQVQMGDTSILEFYNTELQGFAAWVLTLGAYVSIVEPPELQQIIQDKIVALYNNHVK